MGTSRPTVSSDTDGMGKSHLGVYTKSTLAEQTTPAALTLTGISKSVSAVSIGDRDWEANHVDGDVPWTPPVSDANIKAYVMYLAIDAVGSGGALAGSVTVGT